MPHRTLVISNISWNFVWQRHQTVATFFASKGEVLFCEIPGIRCIRIGDLPRIVSLLLNVFSRKDGIGTLPDGVRRLRPLLLPATNPLFHRLNEFLLRRFLRTQSSLRDGVNLIVNYSPSRSALELIRRVPHAKLIYDCTDNWAAVKGRPNCLQDDEDWLLASADITFVPSTVLQTLKQGCARRLVHIPHGVLVDRFRVTPRSGASPSGLTLLYYGHLHKQHFDFHAVQLMASQRPRWKIVLIGPIKNRRRFPQNVILIEQQRHEALKRFIQDADVLLLPYTINEYTRSVMPAKIFECLATGRPIVAAPLPELVAGFSSYLTIAKGPDNWASAVEEALQMDSDQARRSRIALAEGNSWELRFAQMWELLSA